MGEKSGSEIIHRQLETDADNPAVQVSEAIADIEGKDATDLSQIYHCVDGVLDEIFSNPPSPEAQMEVTFTYEGFRVTIEQNGRAKFVRTE